MTNRVLIDASAIVAILEGEPDEAALMTAFAQAGSRFTTLIALFESFAALIRLLKGDAAKAEERLREFVHEFDVKIAAIDEIAGESARKAFVRFGKGRGHRAQLNMGDCFAHGAARSIDAALLFKGDDFIHTDIEPALPAGA